MLGFLKMASLSAQSLCIALTTLASISILEASGIGIEEIGSRQVEEFKEFDYFALSLQWPATICHRTRHCCSTNACCRGFLISCCLLASLFFFFFSFLIEIWFSWLCWSLVNQAEYFKCGIIYIYIYMMEKIM